MNQKAVSKEEIARHCKRRTRGTKETVDAIEEVLLSFSMATDPLGVPVLKEEMKVIWEEQVKHVTYIQDPPGVQLYTVTGNLKKGHVTLPILRCARGSTSTWPDSWLEALLVPSTFRHTSWTASAGGTPLVLQQQYNPPQWRPGDL